MRILLSLLLPLLCASCQSESESFTTLQLLNVKNDSDLLKTTVYIETKPNISDTVVKKGTAFFYYNAKNKVIYLITNKHALRGQNVLTFALKNNGCWINSACTSFPINNVQNYCTYSSGLGQDSDLVAVNLTRVNFNPEQYNIKAFTFENLPDINKPNYQLFTSNIYCLSFPGNITFFPNNFPYTIKCSLATPYYFDYRGNKEFCINGDLVQGCSGSPIVSIDADKENPKYTLLGIDSYGFIQFNNLESIYFNQNSKLISSKKIFDTLAVSHQVFLDIGIKSAKILELIN